MSRTDWCTCARSGSGDSPRADCDSQAIIDEIALRRRVGTPALMRGQLQYLLDICDRPAVSIQVCPFLTGASYAAPGSFSILQFATDDLSDIVYVEQLTSALYLDKRAEVHQYTTRWIRSPRRV